MSKKPVVSEETKKEIRDLFVSGGKSCQELAKLYDLELATVKSWMYREGWKAVRDRNIILAKQLADSIGYLADPMTEEKAMIEGNARLALQIQGFHLAKLKHDMLSDKPLLDITDAVQKYATALEKLEKTIAKSKAGGVDSKVVKHFHIDMDKALELAMTARKQGKMITINEAAEALIKAGSKQEDDKQ